MQSYIPMTREDRITQRIFQKNLGNVSMEQSIIGFLDESAPQTTSNTVRL